MKIKIKFLFLSIIILQTTIICNGQPANQNWVLIPESSDEFNGTAVDTMKWNPKPGYSTSRAFYFRFENVAVQGGFLRLTAKKEDFKGKSYTSAYLESKFDDPGNGSYVEVRARSIDVRANVCCAIWEQTFPLKPSLDPNPEIDIQEFLLSGFNGNPNRVQSTLHRWWRTGNKHLQDTYQVYDAKDPLCYDYHIYALERRDGKLRFYLDGFKYWEVDMTFAPEYVTMPRHMIFSLEGHAGNPVDFFLPGVFMIDYIRTYKFAGQK